MSNIAGKEGNRNVIVMRQILLVPLLFSMSGCLVFGVDPKTEIRTHEEREEFSGVTPNDSFSSTVVSIDRPCVSVSREACELKIRIEASQLVVPKAARAFYKEKWEIEDGKAVSVGVMPGYGPCIYNPKWIYETESMVEALCIHTFITPIANCCALGLPTISSLSFGQVELMGGYRTVESGLIGGCPFPTGKPTGETMVERNQENFFATSTAIPFGEKHGIDAPIVATITIPSLWYRKTVTIAPQYESDGNIISSAVIDLLTDRIPPKTSGMVSLSFVDESGKYGALLAPYQGMTTDFVL